jgi:peptidyl-prolyl cis-trans isomerase SurA
MLAGGLDMQSVRLLAGCLIACSLLAVPTARAEIVEEIVALIDGDILTKSDYDEHEQEMVQDIYRRYTGAELDKAIEAIRTTLLMDLIDRKILVHRAGRMFDTERMKDVFYESFRDQQQVETDEELLDLIQGWGMDVDGLKSRLIDMFAPDEVVRFEVSSRISIADHEVDAYYAEHQEEFRHDDEAELREIVLMADDRSAKQARREEVEKLHAGLTAENFAQTATESSEAGTKAEGGHLGKIKRGDLSRMLEDVAFGLTPGAWSAILETPYGFHILYAENVQLGTVKPLEEVRDDLRVRLEDQRFEARLAEFMVKARGESEWCVKSKFVASLPARHVTQVCEEM